MQQTFEALKCFFQKNGIPLFGIADSRRLDSEPEGYRPSDVLASASRILCFGLPVPRGLFHDRKRLNKNYWRMASIYYQRIDMISSQAAAIIEGQHELASPILS